MFNCLSIFCGPVQLNTLLVKCVFNRKFPKMQTIGWTHLGVTHAGLLNESVLQCMQFNIAFVLVVLNNHTLAHLMMSVVCVLFFFLLLSSSLSLLYKLFLPLHVLTSKQSSKNIFQRINSNINNMFFNMYIPDVFPAFLIFLQNNNRAHKIAYNNVYRNLCTILFC